MSHTNTNNINILITTSTDHSSHCPYHNNLYNFTRFCRRYLRPSMEIQITLPILYNNPTNINLSRYDPFLSNLALFNPPRKNLRFRSTLSTIYNMFRHLQNKHNKHNGRYKWFISGSINNSNLWYVTIFLHIKFDPRRGIEIYL